MFDTQKMLEELIEVKRLMNTLKEKEENLKAYLKADDTFTGYKDDNVIIKKYKKRTTVLKEGIEKQDMIDKYPEATKQSLDMKALASIEDAHQYLELQEEDALTVQIK